MEAGWILRMKVSFSIPPQASYSILAQPLSSINLQYSSRRREVSEQRGGSSLLPVDGVMSGSWLYATGSHQRRCHHQPFSS